MYDINLTMSNIIVGQEFTEPIDTLGIGYLYFNSLKEHAKKNLIAQIDVRTGETDTYALLLKRSIRTALYLKEIGIQKDDVVCLIGSNHLNSCVPFIASHFIGAIPSSIETLMPYDDLKHLINLIEPKIFFVTPNKVELVEKILKELKKKSQCVIFGHHENHICFDNMIKEHKDENTFQPEKITDLKETAMLYFSSGTTGLPKAVCLNHYSFMICALNKHEPENLDTEALKWQISKISNQYVGLTYKHLSWISAGLILFKSLYHGNIVILAEEFNSTEVWHIIEKYNVNLFSMLITHAIELIQNGKPDDIDVSSLTTIILAGARIPNSIFEDLRKLFPTTLIFQSYAQTELTGMNTFFNTMDKTHRQRIQENPQAVGYAGKYVTYKVVDPETEDILGPNQEGELRFKSATMMNGYYKMDSKPYFDDEGYFKSGDVGYYDDNNCFFITNRIKEIFKYGDVHVSPAAIEEVIYRHPAVREAAVIGVPDVEIGDRAVGVVVLKENVQVTPEEIKEFVDSQVDETKKLRGGLIFVDSLPYGSNGKIKVMQLRSIIINSNSNRISDV